MIIEDLIEKEYASLKSEMTFKEARELFEETKLNDLPIVDGEAFKGILFVDQVEGKGEDKDLLGEIEDQYKSIAVKMDERMIIALKKMTKEGVGNLPVIDDQGEMQGVILSDRLWSEFAVRSSLLGAGGWIVLSVKKRDYKFSEIAQIVESNSMMILMHFVHFFHGVDLIDVHIKVDRENVNELVQTFQRYEYSVSDVIQPKKFEDDWEERFDQLMRFFST